MPGSHDYKKYEMSAEERSDILTVQDIKCLVDHFYNDVKSDELLGPVFNERIKDRWPEHLEKMYSFWRTVLFNQRHYRGTPFPAHATLAIEHIHFQRWLQLFDKSVDGQFEGNKAEEAKLKARKIAQIFEAKIGYCRTYGYDSA